MRHTNSAPQESDQYQRYTNARFAPILLKGYRKNQNPTRDYQTAKQPMVTGFTSEAYKSPGTDLILDHEGHEGWIGWRLPPGIMVIDNEDPDTMAEIDRICRDNRPPTQKTTNGKQWTFSCDGDLRGADGVYTRSGLKVTYRLPMKNYVIMPPTNGRSWEHEGDLEQPPLIPESLLHCRMDNREDLLNCIAWEVHRLKKSDSWGKYEDLLSLSCFLVKIGIERDRIHEVFKTIFGRDYDQRKTEYFLERDDERLEQNDPVLSAGTYFASLKEKDLHDLKRFSLALEKVLQADTRTEARDVEEEKVTTIDDPHIIPVTRFPFEVFPKRFIDAVNSFSESKLVEPEVTATVMLTILSGAIGNTVQVASRQDFVSPIQLWSILIAPTGSGKTPLISTLMKPVRDIQGEESQRYADALKEYEMAMHRCKKGEDVDVPDKPRGRHLFVSDATVEALRGVFEDDPRGVIVYLDEIAGLILGFNQYKHGGNDRQKYLELFNGDPWKIDRLNSNKFVPNTGASVLGGIQTSIMPQVFKTDSFDDGLLPRFLLLCTKGGASKFSRVPINEETMKYWKALLGRAYTIPLVLNDTGFVNHKLLLLKESALEQWIPFYDDLNELSMYLTERARAFIPKLTAYYSLKFAGLIHCIKKLTSGDGSLTPVIGDETVLGAIALTNYFAGQAIKALRLYQPEDERLNEFQIRMIKVLYQLKNNVRNGRLSVSEITGLFNQGLKGNIQHSPKMVGSILKSFHLKTEPSTDHLYVLLWEEGRIEGLFTRVTFDDGLEKSNKSNISNVFPENKNSDEEDLPDDLPISNPKPTQIELDAALRAMAQDPGFQVHKGRRF